MSRREAAGWFLERYLDGLSEDYYQAACTAVFLIAEAAGDQGLTGSERRILEKLRSTTEGGSLPALATSALVQDATRGLPEIDRFNTIRRAWLDRPGAASGFLVLNKWQMPEALKDYWHVGFRWEKVHKPQYEGMAGDHYFRFRSMKFPSVQAEMVFLWERIIAQYVRSARRGEGPNDLEVFQYEEARAATARLIEIGRPAVSFLLARKDFILRAAQPQDPRSTVGDVYEIWVMRTLLDPAFTPLLRQLARCGSKKVEDAAADALDRLERDDPYSYRALNVFQFRSPVGK